MYRSAVVVCCWQTASYDLEMGKSARRVAMGVGVAGALAYSAWATWVVASVAATMPKPPKVVPSSASSECDALARRVESRAYGMRARLRHENVDTLFRLTMILGAPSSRSSIAIEPGSAMYTWSLERQTDGDIVPMGTRASRGGRWVADFAKARVDTHGKVVELELAAPTAKSESWCTRVLE